MNLSNNACFAQSRENELGFLAASSPSSGPPTSRTRSEYQEKCCTSSSAVFLLICEFCQLVVFHDVVVFSRSFDGIVLVTQSHETLPTELECLKAPLQDYSSVS